VTTLPRTLLAALLAAAWLAGASAQAQTSWNSLDPGRRAALEPLRDNWTRLSPDQQQKWLAIADRFDRLPPAERERLQRRMDSWVQLSPGERDRARQNYQESRRFDGDDRRARWEAYQALPPEQRREFSRDPLPPARELPPQRSRREFDADGADAPPRDGRKSNLVRPVPEGPPQRVAPSVLRARPGATTTLMSRPAQPPAHQQAGLPKIAATPGFVEPRTLLPQRGAQGAGIPPPRERNRKDNKNR
jgi:hypothetical protein